MVTVRATDPGGLFASINVTINVMGVDEVPDVTGDATKDYVENGTGSVATYRATDPEGRTIYWSLLPTTGTPPTDIAGTDVEDVDDFSISAQGVLTFKVFAGFRESEGRTTH